MESQKHILYAHNLGFAYGLSVLLSANQTSGIILRPDRQASMLKLYYKIIKQSSVTKNTYLGLL